MWTLILNKSLKIICVLFGAFGIFLGIDLMLGAKITRTLKAVVDKGNLAIDKMILSAREVLDRTIDVDKKILNSKYRLHIGLLIALLSMILIMLSRNI